MDIPAPIPSTLAYIGYHAARRPDHDALIVGGRHVSYAAFYADIGRTAAALKDFGLGPGDTVGVGCSGFYVHWMCLLALEALGGATFSYLPRAGGNVHPGIAGADLILCSPGDEPKAARRVHVADGDWTRSVRQSTPQGPLVAAPAGPDTPMRIVCSSGTTGSLKQMVHTGRVREFWLRQYLFRTGFTRESRYLVAMGFHIEAIHTYATACIRMGGTCVHVPDADIPRALSEHEVTHATFAPHMLTGLLDGLPEEHRALPGLTIFTISAPVRQQERERIRRMLAGEVVESYGTQEVAAICTMEADGTGTVMPDITVEVVDDDGNPVRGAPGLLRVRSGGSVGGYLDDAAATRRMFRDGWFYPGDVAVMRDERRIELVGRADDIIGIGGKKIAAGPVEQALRQELPVADLCVTAVPDEAGGNRLCVVVVPLDDDSVAVITERLPALLQAGLGSVVVVPVNEVPRTVTGKVRRAALNEALRRQLAT
jgi:acyl-CoA synthetase (AMP-forming)/AMP-acid ligase II